MSKSDLSTIFSNAWDFFNKNLFSTFGAALKSAWKKFKLIALLRLRKVKITFRKSNSEITSRIATLSQKFFQYQSKTSNRVPKLDVISFYSITDEGFRSFRIERLLDYKVVA